MAIEAVFATVPLKAGERLAGLNHVAELRARYWGDSWKEVERFVDDMRDKSDPQFEENNRALAIHITKEGMSGTEAAELLRRVKPPALRTNRRSFTNGRRN